MKQVVAIVGPTAVGKTSLAISLARALDGEIVNADSRQVYRHMDIGTAKPTPRERSAVPHHLIDVVDPDQTFSLTLFQGLAHSAIKDIRDRGKLPLLVGGSGLYVWSVIEGWKVPEVPPDPQFRRQMEERAAGEGVDTLFEELEAVDPDAAGKIDPHNVRRVIRALEVCRATGTRFSELQSKQKPPFDAFILGLTTGREELYRRIDDRVERMMDLGLAEEVKGLLSRGYSADLPAMSSVGYGQMVRALRGDLDLPAAIQQIKYETHRFARHQYGWFRPGDARIHWLESHDNVETDARSVVMEHLDT